MGFIHQSYLFAGYITMFSFTVSRWYGNRCVHKVIIIIIIIKNFHGDDMPTSYIIVLDMKIKDFFRTWFWLHLKLFQCPRSTKTRIELSCCCFHLYSSSSSQDILYLSFSSWVPSLLKYSMVRQSLFNYQIWLNVFYKTACFLISQP